MIRDSLGANAGSWPHGHPGGGPIYYRPATGAPQEVSTGGIVAPHWVKLVRDGDLVKGYVSTTGADGTWTFAGSAAVPMGHTALVGLAVTAHNNTALATATFDNVGVAPTIPLGANIAAVRDWSLANAFVDMMKQSRPFTSLARPWTPATTDANGWATEDFLAIVQTGSLNTANVYNGVYKLSFTGQASVSAFTPGLRNQRRTTRRRTPRPPTSQSTPAIRTRTGTSPWSSATPAGR
jgi:hypothetical protein